LCASLERKGKEGEERGKREMKKRGVEEGERE
jgi:hypothetical protein